LYVRVISPDNGWNKTPPNCTTDAVTVVPAGVTLPVFAIEIAFFCPPLAIHSIEYEYPVQSPERTIFKNPKSGDDCNRLAKSAAEIPTGIDEYVCPLNTIS
jgi:hypothetical protein